MIQIVLAALLLIAAILALLICRYVWKKYYVNLAALQEQISKHEKIVQLKEELTLQKLKNIEAEELNRIQIQASENEKKLFMRLSQEKSKILSEIEAFRDAELASARRKNDELINEIKTNKMKEMEREFEQKLKNLQMAYDIQNESLKRSGEQLTQNMLELQKQERAAITARIRQYEEKHKEEFYSIQIGDEELQEVVELESIISRFKNPLPLRKAIFDAYYKEPIRDMIARITENKRISGIYKITHKESGKCYIGQSVNIADRWLQHCKRGCGTEPLTGSKLYPEMLRYGIHAFTFEIIEEVAEGLLSQKEKFWGEYFGAKVFGYSIKN